MNVSEWLEKKYLEYQINNGRLSLRSFAKKLEISPGYLSQLMNGTNSKFSYDVARKICEVIGDWELFDLLNYKRPPEADLIPNDFKMRLEKAMNETNRVLRERNLTGEMPESEKVTIEIFERYGFKHIDTKTD